MQFSSQVGFKIRRDRNEVWNCMMTQCLVISDITDLNIIRLIISSYAYYTHNV